MEKHYIRIDINGDPGKLPEKEGIYIVFVKDEASIVQWKYAPFPEDKKDWLENIDWYLQPVTSNDLKQAEPAEAKDEWISVKDRLPKLNITSSDLCIVFNGRIVTAGYYSINKFAKTEKGKSPRWNDIFGRIMFGEVTHWMPLPKAPDTKQKE